MDPGNNRPDGPWAPAAGTPRRSGQADPDRDYKKPIQENADLHNDHPSDSLTRGADGVRDERVGPSGPPSDSWKMLEQERSADRRDVREPSRPRYHSAPDGRRYRGELPDDPEYSSREFGFKPYGKHKDKDRDKSKLASFKNKLSEFAKGPSPNYPMNFTGPTPQQPPQMFGYPGGYPNTQQKYSTPPTHVDRDLRDKIQQLNEELSAAQGENQYVRNENARLREDRERLVRTLENSQLFLGPQDDANVINAFAPLYHRLRSWSTVFVTDRGLELFPQYSQLEPNHKLLITTALGREDDLDRRIRHRLKDKSLRRLFVEGIIGAFICHNILNLFDSSGFPTGGHDYWTEPGFAEAFGYLEINLASNPRVISPRELNDWRAFTASLISKLSPNGVVIENTKLYLQKESKGLIDLISCLAKEETDLASLQLKLIEIFELAVNFVKLIRSQRARFSVKYPSPFKAVRLSTSGVEAPACFDKATMVDNKGSDEDDDETKPNSFPNAPIKNVNIFIFPGLFKSGNADGERYDVEECIVKSLVNCHEQSSKR